MKINQCCDLCNQTPHSICFICEESPKIFVQRRKYSSDESESISICRPICIRDVKIVFYWKSIIVCWKSIFFRLSNILTPWWPIKLCLEAWSAWGREIAHRQTDRPAVATHSLPSPNDDVHRNSISVEWYGIAEGSRHAWTTQQYLDKTDNADRRGIVVTS